jgi:propionyl-CoA synthetase
MRYDDVHELSVENPRFFWRQKMDLIHWFKQPEEVLGLDDNGLYRWYRGGKLNTCHLALDYHVDNGRGRQVALYYDSAAAHTRRRYTYRELRDEVAKFAGVLKGLGVEKGADRRRQA